MSSTTGNSSVDVGQSLELASAALQLATGYHPDLGDYGEQEDSRGVLTQQGNLVIKIFEVSSQDKTMGNSSHCPCCPYC